MYLTSEAMDEQVEDIVIKQMGLGVGGVIAGGVIGAAIGQPVTQFVGSDREVANLEQGLTMFNEMFSIVEGSVNAGALTPTKGFEKLDTWDIMLGDLEAQIKLAAITSPNVRISAGNVKLQARLLKLRERLQDQRRAVAAAAIGRQLETADPAVIAAFMVSMEEKFKAMLSFGLAVFLLTLEVLLAVLHCQQRF